MAKKNPEPPPEPPKKKTIRQRLADARDRQDIAELKRIQKSGGHKYDPTIDVPEAKQRRANHQSYHVNARGIAHSHVNCYCTQYSSDHPF